MSRPEIAPYRGLTPFEDSDLDVLFFFGRDRERELIVANMMASRLTVLYGETGVGKSSVLRAGVAHHLRSLEGPLAVIVFDEWRDEPEVALGRAAAAAAGTEAGGTLADTLERCTALLDGELYVILDGVEEYFLYHEAEAGEDGFAAEFGEAVRRPGLRASFLFSLREDALAKLDRFKGRVPNLFANYLRLEHLDREAARRAILGPLERYAELVGSDERVEIEPELVEAVLAEVAAGRVELGQAGQGVIEGRADDGRVETPYLQLVMQRLWDEERGAGSSVLRLSTLRELGGAEQIVRDHLRLALDRLDAAQQDLVADAFDHLVTPSGTKIAHAVSDLARYADVEEDALVPVLETLAEQRIVRPVADETGVARYEIYHDVLAEAVLAWRTRHEADRRLELEREGAERRHRRLLWLLGGAAVLLALMAGVTVFALAQRSEANHQTSIATEATSRAKRNADVARRASRRARANLQQAKAEAARANRNAATARSASRRARANLQLAQAETARANQNAANTQSASRRARANLQLAQAETARANRNAENAQSASRRANANLQLAQAETARANQNAANAQTATQQAQRQARAAEAGELAATSLSELSTTPEKAVQDAVQAAELGARNAEAVLRNALAAASLSAILPAHGPVSAASFSPDGSLVVTADAAPEEGGAAQIFRTDGKQLRTLRVGTHVSSATFSPDGRLVVTTSRDGFARLWNVATGTLLRKLSHGGRPVRSASFSPDGTLLATASNDKTVRIWEVASGKQRWLYRHPRVVLSVSFDHEGGNVLTVDGQAARLLDATTGRLLSTFEQGGAITSAAFSPDDRLVVTTGADNLADLWNAATGALIFKLKGHSGDVLSANFSPDGEQLVTGGADGDARVWSVSDGSLRNILVGHGLSVVRAVFSPDSRFILTASADGTARVWDSETGRTVAVLAGHRGRLTDASFNRKSLVVTASDDGSARVWNPRTASELVALGPRSGRVGAVSFSPSGKFVLSAHADGTAKVWRAGGGLVRSLQLGGDVVAASFSRNGRLVLAGSDDGDARVWRASDGLSLLILRHGAPVRSALFSPDASLVATAGSDGNVKIWRRADGKVLSTLTNGSPLACIAFSPDGRLIAAAGQDGVARTWRVSDGRLLKVFRGHSAAIVAIAFSPRDGRLLATASTDRTARIWDVQKGVATEVLRHSDRLTSIAFSPDGSRLVTTGADHNAIVWRVRDGRKLQVDSQSAVISDAAFSFDGRWLVTAGPLRAGLWETGVGQSKFSALLRGHEGQLTSVAFSPRGWRIATGGVDGTVRSYECELCGAEPQLVSIAKAQLSALAKTLTPAQRRKYLR